MRTGSVAACFALLLVGVSQAATTSLDSGTVVDTVTSLDQVEEIIRDTQWRFWQLVPPATDDPFYLHSERIVRTVNWDSKEWPQRFLKQMYAEMGTVGSYGSMYPFYRLTVVEDRSGDIVYYNSYDQEVWRTSAPKDYNPYLFAFLTYGVETVDDLSYQQQVFGRSSNVGTEIWLLPESFASTYEADAAMDAEAAPLASEPLISEESMMMSMSSMPEPPGGGGTNTNSTGSVTNTLATLTFSVPSGFGSSTGEIFQCTNLVDVVSWDIGVESIAVTAGTDLVWTDVTSSNIPCRFYILNDPSKDLDLDGLNDGIERYVRLTDPTLPDTSGDGLWDGWLVQYGLNPLALNTLGDGDNDGFSNLEEQEKGTDPTSHTSGGDTGTVATIRYYYDEDDRMIDFFCGSGVAQKTILSASHNISEEVSAK